MLESVGGGQALSLQFFAKDEVAVACRHHGWTIAGGSNEIMRNIISERILGMPKG